jgi:hypothetical protein
MNTSHRRTLSGLLILAIVFGGVTIARANAPCYSYDENCKGLIKKGAIIGGIVIAAVVVLKIASHSHAKAKADAAPRRLNVYYDPSAGQALYHVVMNARANCPGSWSALSAEKVSGKLPPGMALDGSNIVGTPDLPGSWQAGVEFGGLSCQGRDGKIVKYADQLVRVDIKISE